MREPGEGAQLSLVALSADVDDDPLTAGQRTVVMTSTMSSLERQLVRLQGVWTPRSRDDVDCVVAPASACPPAGRLDTAQS